MGLQRREEIKAKDYSGTDKITNGGLLDMFIDSQTVTKVTSTTNGRGTVNDVELVFVDDVIVGHPRINMSDLPIYNLKDLKEFSKYHNVSVDSFKALETVTKAIITFNF